jgi:hypothetical protein
VVLYYAITVVLFSLDIRSPAGRYGVAVLPYPDGSVPAPPTIQRTEQAGRNGQAGRNRVDVFALRDRLVADYEEFTRSFIHVTDDRIKEVVNRELAEGLLWPESLVQLPYGCCVASWHDDAPRGLSRGLPAGPGRRS